MCGGAHAYMNSPVIVLSQAEFDARVDDQSGLVTQHPAVRGKRISETKGCIACHSIDGSPSVGPTWLALYAAERQLVDGTTAIADDEYLRLSIVQPEVNIPVGYPPNVMPGIYDELLTDQQIEDIIAYIRSLE